MPTHLGHHQKQVYKPYSYNPSTNEKEHANEFANSGKSSSGQEHANEFSNSTSNSNAQEHANEFANWGNDSFNNSSNNSSQNNNNQNKDASNKIPKWPEDNDLESNIPEADTSWTDNTVVMNDWQSQNDNVNTFFTGGGTKLNSSNWETQKLFDAGQKILKELGLEDTKKNMQIAMNILQGGDRIWGKTSRALQDINSTQYNNIMNIVGEDAEGNRKSWDTWGTNLRGDATYGGDPISQEDYNDKLTARAGNWEGGSNMHQYQRMLNDAWHTANPNWKESGSNKLGGIIIGAMLPFSPSVAGLVYGASGLETLKGNLTKPQNSGELMTNPLGAIIPDGWINNPKEGIKKLKINGKQITINDKMVNRGDEDGGIFSKYDLMEPNVGNDSGVNKSSPYYNSSYNVEDDRTESIYGTWIGTDGPWIGDVIDSDGDGIDDRWQSGPGEPSQKPDSEQGTSAADDNPAWWNFKLFETIFSPFSALKYQEGDVVQNKPEDIAVNTVRKLLEQSEVDEQAKYILKTLIEENEVIANVVNKYNDIKTRINKLIGPIEISADVEDLSVQAKAPSGFMAKADLGEGNIELQKQLGDLNLTANYNPEQQSGFLGLQKEF